MELIKSCSKDTMHCCACCMKQQIAEMLWQSCICLLDVLPTNLPIWLCLMSMHAWHARSLAALVTKAAAVRSVKISQKKWLGPENWQEVIREEIFYDPGKKTVYLIFKVFLQLSQRASNWDNATDLGTRFNPMLILTCTTKLSISLGLSAKNLWWGKPLFPPYESSQSHLTSSELPILSTIRICLTPTDIGHRKLTRRLLLLMKLGLRT